MNINKIEDYADRALGAAEGSLWVRYGLSLLPGGEILEGELFRRIRTEREERFKRFIQELSDRLRDLEETESRRMYLDSESFQSLFERTMKAVIESQHNEKIRLFANIMENQIETGGAFGLLESYFIRCIEDLEVAHIRILARISSSKTGVIYYTIDQVFGDSMSREELLAIQNDLIVKRLVSSKGYYSATADFPEVKTTSLGLRFIDFIGHSARRELDQR